MAGKGLVFLAEASLPARHKFSHVLAQTATTPTTSQEHHLIPFSKGQQSEAYSIICKGRVDTTPLIGR